MVLLRFTAAWCQPCKRIGPAADNLARLNGADVQVIDIDVSPELADAHSVQSVPTFVLTGTDGAVLFRGSGAPALTGLAEALTR